MITVNFCPISITRKIASKPPTVDQKSRKFEENGFFLALKAQNNSNFSGHLKANVYLHPKRNKVEGVPIGKWSKIEFTFGEQTQMAAAGSARRTG